MRSLTLVVSMCLAAAALCCSAISWAAPADSLWVKAVTLSEKNNDLVPGNMKSHMQEVDKHGKPKDEGKYHETWAKLSLNENGDVEFETVKAIEDGRDVTEERVAKEEDERAKRSGENEDDEAESHDVEDYSPFASGSQERISIVRSETGEFVDGKNTVIYEFTEHAEDDEEVSGKAWLEVGTGVPVKIEYTVDPLPKRVKRLVTTMEYGYIAPDSLVVKRMFIEATGGFLFIKKHFHMNMYFSDHWRMPADQ
jgi:hypothetical protein